MRRYSLVCVAFMFGCGGIPFEGRILDGLGHARAGFSVEVYGSPDSMDPCDYSRSGSQTLKTDAEGRFRGTTSLTHVGDSTGWGCLMLAAQPDRELWVQSGDTRDLQSPDDDVRFADIHVWAPNATVNASAHTTAITFEVPPAVAALADRFVLVPSNDDRAPWIEAGARVFSVPTASFAGLHGLHIVAAQGGRSPSPTYVSRGHPSLRIVIP